MIRHTLAAIALTSVALTAAPAAFADKAPIYTGTFSNQAAQGYDVVAYFTDSAPVKGDKAFSTTYQGAEFRFVSQDHLDKFRADPTAYAPQYGGYCAWAMADGKFAKGDASYWTIENGKLYLNFNQSVQDKWNKDRAGFIEKANSNWPDVLKK